MTNNKNKKNKKKGGGGSKISAPMIVVPQAAYKGVVASTAQGKSKKGKGKKNKGGGGGGMSSTEKMKHHKVACSLLDPFCNHALNAKFPDGQTTNTLTYQSRTLGTFTIGANGYESYCFAPDSSDAWLLSDSTNGTWNGSFTVVDSALTAIVSTTGIAENVRIVSAGFRIHWTYPSTQTKPIVTVTEIPDATDLFGVVMTPGAISGIGQNTKIFSGENTITWVMRPTDNNKRVWITPAQSSTTTRSKTYNAAVIQIAGTAGANYGSIEFITNFEYTVKANNAYNQFASQAPPANPMAIAAAKNVLKNNPGAVQASAIDFTSFLEKKAMGALDQVLNYGADALMGMLAI